MQLFLHKRIEKACRAKSAMFCDTPLLDFTTEITKAILLCKKEYRDSTQNTVSEIVLANGQLGIADQEKHLGDTPLGKIVTALNWTRCITFNGPDLVITPRLVLATPIPDGHLTLTELQCAYDVAKILAHNNSRLSIRPDMSIMSSDVGWDYIVIQDTETVKYHVDPVELHEFHVYYGEGEGSHSYSYSLDTSVSFTAHPPEGTFGCTVTFGGSVGYSKTYAFSCSTEGKQAYAWYDKNIRVHDHVWDTWYWYVDYPDGPKNYTYLGRNSWHDEKEIGTTWGTRTEPIDTQCQG